MSFWSELKRRNVVKVGMAYGVVGWLMIEVASVLGPALSLPSWTTSLVAFLVMLGFPVALVLAWAYELTPDGVKRTVDVPPAESMTRLTGQKLNYIVTGLLVVAVGFLVLESLVERSDDQEATVGTLTEGAERPVEALAPQGEPDASDLLRNSIAVLPFVNLSPNPNNEFFAAGIHDTILNELAKIEDMNVIARQSVLRYADGQTPISRIAEELRVETVMEGSIQVAEGRVLVTAQLIDPQTNAHIWSRNYNREFAGIFEIQADIAQRIAMALEAELTQDERASIEQGPTASAEAYTAYLRATAILDSNGMDAAVGTPGLRSSMASYLDEAIELDPAFALAYAQRAYLNVAILHLETSATEDVEARLVEFEGRALADLDQATALDPDLAAAHWVRARIHQYNWRGTEAEAEYARALELANDPRIIADYAWFKALKGEPQEGIGLARRAVALAPNNGLYLNVLSICHSMAGDVQTAAAVNRQAIDLGSRVPTVYTQQAVYEWVLGNEEAALEHIRTAEVMLESNSNLVFTALIAYFYGFLERRDEVARLFRVVEEESATRRVIATGWIFAYLASRDYERALEWMRRAASDPPLYEGHVGLATLSFNGWHDPVLERPEFIEARSRLGFRGQATGN